MGEPAKEKVYYDEDEELKQSQLWSDAEKKHKWYDAPPKVKENKTRKVLKEDGPRQIAKSKKAVAYEFLWWSGAIPISLIVDENKRDLTAKYKKDKMMFMKVFKGSYKIEPIYVDSDRLCNMLPRSKEEYNKCSGGQGKIASKVIMDQYFEPSFLFNLPPLSWFIRETTVKTTITLLKMLQQTSALLRGVPSWQAGKTLA